MSVEFKPNAEDALLCAAIMRDIELPDTWAGDVIGCEKNAPNFYRFL